MHLNKSKYTQRIEHYFSGKLSEQEKHALEQEALEDPFLQDALDGFSSQPAAVEHFNKTLNRKQSHWATYFGIGTIAILGLTLIVLNNTADKPTIESHPIQAEKQLEENLSPVLDPIQDIEIIPAEIEVLTAIDDHERIVSKTLASDFSKNEHYPEPQIQSTEQDHDSIHINIDAIDIEEPEFKIVQKTVETEKQIYPYLYFYDMAVVDYRNFENRARPINKTTYKLSGLSAASESHEKHNETHMVETTTEVSYMDYLEETMYYFSKSKYKYALKRFKVISAQYRHDLNAHFYGGLCYYNLGDFKSALTEFEAIISLKEMPFIEEANWYKAKTLIKLNQMPLAKSVLTDIIAKKGFYAHEAMALLNTL